jgi:hypothetical protein
MKEKGGVYRDKGDERDGFIAPCIPSSLLKKIFPAKTQRCKESEKNLSVV